MYNSHKKRTKKVEGAVPCGNPKRYGSRDVVHMPPLGCSDRKHNSSCGYDSTATEAEKHLQTLLTNQIKTDVTLSQQFSQHRAFSLATSHNPEANKLAGVHNYDQYRVVEDLDNRIDLLRHCGLNDEEITLKLTDEFKYKVPITREGYGVDPESKIDRLKEIERKIQEKKEALNVPDTFKGALQLSRHALELEKSQDQRFGSAVSRTSVITTKKSLQPTHPDDPINHIQEMLFDLEGNREPRRDRRRRRKLEQKRLYYEAFSNDGGGDVTSSNYLSSDGSGVTSSSSLSNVHSLHHDHGIGNPSILLNSDINVESCGSLHSHPSVSSVCTAIAVSEVSQKSHNEQNKDVATSNRQSETSPIVSSKIVQSINTPVQFISESEIKRNRLSLPEILAIDKFQNYTPGQVNQIVYVKNLPNKTREEDLVALFGSFQSQDKPKIVFKLLTGRMKGQAFITFPDVQTASRAMDTVNGYLFQDKPIILSYGKQNQT